jgi:hypothetical protein
LNKTASGETPPDKYAKRPTWNLRQNPRKRRRSKNLLKT